METKRCSKCSAFLKKDNTSGLCQAHEAEVKVENLETKVGELEVEVTTLKEKVIELETEVNDLKNKKPTNKKRGRKTISDSVKSISLSIAKVFEGGDTEEARQALKDWFDASQKAAKAVAMLKKVKPIAIEMGLIPQPARRGRPADPNKVPKEPKQRKPKVEKQPMAPVVIPEVLTGLEISSRGKVTVNRIKKFVSSNELNDEQIKALFSNFEPETRNVFERYVNAKLKEQAITLGLLGEEFTPKVRQAKPRKQIEVDVIPAELDGLEVGKNGKVSNRTIWNFLCKTNAFNTEVVNEETKQIIDNLFIHFHDLTAVVIKKLGTFAMKKTAVELGYLQIDFDAKKRSRKVKEVNV